MWTEDLGYQPDKESMTNNPITSRSHAWKRESPVNFTVTLMMSAEESGNSPRKGSDEDVAKEESSSDSKSSSEETSSDGSTSREEESVVPVIVKEDTQRGQPNLKRHSPTNQKPEKTIKGILKTNNRITFMSGQSNFGNSISDRFLANEKEDSSGGSGEEPED